MLLVQTTVLIVVLLGNKIALILNESSTLIVLLLTSRDIDFAGISFSLTITLISAILLLAVLTVMFASPTLLPLILPLLSTLTILSLDEAHVNLVSFIPLGVTIGFILISLFNSSSIVLFSKEILSIVLPLTIILQTDFLPLLVSAVMLALPALIPLTIPLSTLTILLLDELHIIVLSVALLGLTLALNII